MTYLKQENAVLREMVSLADLIISRLHFNSKMLPELLSAKEAYLSLRKEIASR